jgi:hypothetical protein
MGLIKSWVSFRVFDQVQIFSGDFIKFVHSDNKVAHISIEIGHLKVILPTNSDTQCKKYYEQRCAKSLNLRTLLFCAHARYVNVCMS